MFYRLSKNFRYSEPKLRCKVMKLDIHEHILQAIQPLYMDVSCSVRIHEHFTDFFPVKQGLKQGCGLSLTLFFHLCKRPSSKIINYCGKIANIGISIVAHAGDKV